MSAQPVVRVIIPTTSGPVDIQGLIEEDVSLGRSVACVNGTTRTAGIDRNYSAFVARGTGVVQRLFKHGAFRLDVSGAIDGGDSWQLAVLLAHALHADGRLAGVGQLADTVVWATGCVSPITLQVG